MFFFLCRKKMHEREKSGIIYVGYYGGRVYMRIIKYLLFTLFISFINIFHVYASCSNEEIASLKELANDIKITHKRSPMQRGTVLKVSPPK